MSRAIALLPLLALVLASGISAADVPRKKTPARPSRSPQAAWSPVVTRIPRGLAPVTMRELALDAQRERHERTLTAELSPGSPSSERTVVLSTTTGPRGAVGVAHVDVALGAAAVQTMKLEVDGPEDAVLASLELVDLDFDGWLDLRVLCASGPRWVTYAVRLFDPGKKIFVDGELARKLGALPNLEARRATRRIVSTVPGPPDASFASYRVEAGALVLERQCVFRAAFGVGSVGTLVVREPDGDRVRERRVVDAPMPPGFPAACEI
jgi:hypothetical protein